MRGKRSAYDAESTVGGLFRGLRSLRQEWVSRWALVTDSPGKESAKRARK